MPVITQNFDRFGPRTYSYLYAAGDGAFLACALDAPASAFADSSVLAAKGLAAVSGQPPLDQTHAWDAATKSVKVLPNPTALSYGQFVALFTPAETVAILESSDAQVKQFVEQARGTLAINLSDPIVVGGIGYLVSLNLLTSQRANQVLAGTAHQ